MSELWHSASSLLTAISCPRKWAYTYIEKLTRPEFASAAKGVRTHAVLERYLKEGETPPYSHPDPDIAEAAEIAGSGLSLIPEPCLAPALRVESQFRYVDPVSGQRFRGARDYVVTRSIPCVGDHKTTSNLAYAKTEETLAQDPQAIVYAHVTMAELEADACDLEWTYYVTRGPRRTKQVHLRMHKEPTADLFSKLAVLSGKLATSFASNSTAERFPRDLTHCDAFGGCPFVGNCAPPPFDRMKARNMTVSTQDLLSQLATRTAQVNEVSNVSQTIPPPAPTPSFAQTSLLSLFSTAPIVGPPLTLAEAMNPEHPEFMSPVAVKMRNAHFDAERAKQASADPAINSPEWTPPPATKEEADGKAAETIPAPPPDVTSEAPKARRGRPAGSKNKAKDEPAAAPASEEAAPSPKELPDLEGPFAVASKKVRTRFTLFVDCTPVGMQTEAAEVYFEEVARRILADHGLADYRYAEYGKGAGIFAVTLAAMADAGEIQGRVVMSSSTPEGAIAMRVLMPRAAYVVRGSR